MHTKTFVALIVIVLSSTANAALPVSYGAATVGGANNAGTVFKLTGSHTREVLYNFCALPGCADGAAPLANVVTMSDGSLVGVTSNGGYQSLGGDGGVIFQLTPTSNGAWAYKVLLDICPFWQDCDHYGHPVGGVTLVNEYTIEGTNESPDGSKGVKWQYQFPVDGYNGYIWSPIQYWTRHKEQAAPEVQYLDMNLQHVK
jgi:uncharacterized repeat protein (TIGR03803 family)